MVAWNIGLMLVISRINGPNVKRVAYVRVQQHMVYPWSDFPTLRKKKNKQVEKQVALKEWSFSHPVVCVSVWGGGCYPHCTFFPQMEWTSTQGACMNFTGEMRGTQFRGKGLVPAFPKGQGLMPIAHPVPRILHLTTHLCVTYYHSPSKMVRFFFLLPFCTHEVL